VQYWFSCIWNDGGKEERENWKESSVELSVEMLKMKEEFFRISFNHYLLGWAHNNINESQFVEEKNVEKVDTIINVWKKPILFLFCHVFWMNFNFKFQIRCTLMRWEREEEGQE
jgi:hypothetical protein